MLIMAASSATSDPLTEFDKLTSEQASLERQFRNGKLPQEEFELLSKQLNVQIAKAEAQAYKLAKKDEDLARKLRIRNYNDPHVQQVISHLLRANVKSLDPQFGEDRMPKYPLESEKGDNLVIEQSILQRLADIGVVRAALYERILYCPRCATPSGVYVRFKCPQCGSIEISINRMMEHLQCGTIHQENAFVVGKNMLCPTCKKLLQKPEEYRLIGVVCSCNACHGHFEDPSQSFFCRKCELDFSLSTALVTDVFAYTMSAEAIDEARRYLGVNVLTDILSQSGFDVKIPGALTGPTREVVFSLVASKDGKTVAVDLAQSQLEVEMEPVLELYIKILEASPTVAILGAVPALSKKARDIAALHNILVAEGTSFTEIGKKVLEIAQQH